MASSKEYLEFVLEQLSGLEDVSFRAMMGEFILYYRGKIVGGIYDDRFLVKPVKAAVAMMPDAELEVPYEGAKEMLLVDNVDDKEFLCSLLEAMYDELPVPKEKGIVMWFWFALGSAVFAALTSILAKVGIEGVDSNLATAVRTVVIVAMAWGMVFLTHQQSGLSEISQKSWVFLVLSGLATGASWLC